jgi:LemA protein
VTLIIVLVVLAVLALATIGLYNKLVGLRLRAQNAWSDIDVQLKRRADLVPNLVETVKGYATHERETLDAVTAARTRAVAAHGAGPAERAEAEAGSARRSAA